MYRVFGDAPAFPSYPALVLSLRSVGLSSLNANLYEDSADLFFGDDPGSGNE